MSAVNHQSGLWVVEQNSVVLTTEQTFSVHGRQAPANDFEILISPQVEAQAGPVAPVPACRSAIKTLVKGLC
jgi:hypothetical protein